MKGFLPVLALLTSVLPRSQGAAVEGYATRSLPLVVDEPPSFVRPYVLPYLRGPAVVLIDDVIRYPVNNASSGGAFSLLQLNGQNYVRSGYGDLFQAPPHYHTRFHETWYSRKGRTNLWANDEARVLYPGDFGSMPVNQNHSYALTEPDTEFYAFISPGGFEDFYINISAIYNTTTNAPFPPDRPVHFEESTFAAAVGSKYDVFPVNHTFAFNFENGTTNTSAPWHTGPNPLPNNSAVPYYVANNYGPKYLQRDLGQVVAPLVSPEQSGGNFTLSTVVMRGKLANETIATSVFDVAQVMLILEGQLSVQIMAQTAYTIPGDVVFIPPGSPFQYWSDVAFTKILLGASGRGLADKLIDDGESWPYAVFPSYVG